MCVWVSILRKRLASAGGAAAAAAVTGDDDDGGAGGAATLVLPPPGPDAGGPEDPHAAKRVARATGQVATRLMTCKEPPYFRASLEATSGSTRSKRYWTLVWSSGNSSTVQGTPSLRASALNCRNPH